jgi:hypothetical protein
MREIRPSGSMSGKWKRRMDRLVRHRQPKGPETDRPVLNHRATSRLYNLPRPPALATRKSSVPVERQRTLRAPRDPIAQFATDAPVFAIIHSQAICRA